MNSIDNMQRRLSELSKLSEAKDQEAYTIVGFAKALVAQLKDEGQRELLERLLVRFDAAQARLDEFYRQDDNHLTQTTAKDGAGLRSDTRGQESEVPPSREPSGRSRRDGLSAAPSPVRGVRV